MALTRLQKIYFGMARFGPSMMLDFISLATTLFYFSLQDLPGIYTGVSQGISYLVIGLAQLGFGHLSDRTKTRWGRRKPYILVGAPLMAITFVLVFTPHWFVTQGDVWGLFIYATVTLSLFKVFYGMVTTPLQAWMPELTDPDERPAVSAWQNIANFLAFTIATLATALLAGLSTGWGLPQEVFMILMVIVAVEIIGFVLPVARLSAEGRFIPQPSFVRELETALKNRDFVGWLVAQGLLSLGFVMITQMAFPYVNDYLRFGTSDMLLFGLELLAVVFSFFLVWSWDIKHVGKRVTLQAAMLLASFSLPLTLIVTTKVGGFVVIALVAAAVSGYYLFPYIVYADFAHKDEILTGEGRAGMYTGLPSIPLNICQAASSTLMGFLLSLPESLPVPSHPGEFVTLGYQLWGPVAAIFIFLSVIVLHWVDLDPDFERLKRERHEPPVVVEGEDPGDAAEAGTSFSSESDGAT